MMTSCWDQYPTQRPSFSELLKSLEQELYVEEDLSKIQCLDKDHPGSSNLAAEIGDPIRNENCNSSQLN